MSFPFPRSFLFLATLSLTGSGCQLDTDPWDTAGDDDPDGASSGSADAASSSSRTEYVEPYTRAQEQLVRIAMALRGRRPAADELAAVEHDPEAIGAIVDAYLETPEFGTTIRDLHNDALLLLADYYVYPAGFPLLPPLEDADFYAVNRTVMEAPLRLVEHVVAEDLPYSEIVAGDFTVTHPLAATIWGVPYDPEVEGWQVSRWEDGRDNAGILSDSWLYQRHRSTPSNVNRGRANAISSALLCSDFLSKNVEIDATVNLADPLVVSNAVRDNPACAACHQSLDPLAGFFGDFMGVFVPAELPLNGVDSYPFTNYADDFFLLQYGVRLAPPNYFGEGASPQAGLSDLGRAIADDPRFTKCAVTRFYAYFHQIELDEVPLEAVAELQEAFESSGLNAKALTKSIVLDDRFTVPSVYDSEDAAGRLKRARPHQLAELVESLTGFRWTTRLASEEQSFDTGRVDLMADSFLGYQVLAGGIDSIYVTKPSHAFGATSSLVVRGLAQRAAGAVARSDLDLDPSQRRLLTLADDEADEDRVRAQLVALHAAVLAERVAPRSPQIDASFELFQRAHDYTGDTRRAWMVTLSSLLQDARVVYY